MGFWTFSITLTILKNKPDPITPKRDCSLAPLLIPYYRKITLIDLRYINYDIVSNITVFNNKDVLFIYSAQVINNSNLLKVNNI